MLTRPSNCMASNRFLKLYIYYHLLFGAVTCGNIIQECAPMAAQNRQLAKSANIDDFVISTSLQKCRLINKYDSHDWLIFCWTRLRYASSIFNLVGDENMLVLSND